MGNKIESDLDTALATLARELSTAEPSPRVDMVAGVLADAAMTSLAAEAHTASPRPSAELVLRVLADAAAVAAERRSAPAPRARALPEKRPSRLAEWLFGWTGGAVAAMVLGLAVGLGVGLEAGPGALPLLDSGDTDLPLVLAESDPGILLMDGL